MKITEDVKNCVVFIAVKNDEGQLRFVATGFFVWLHVPEGGFLYLVTAKHVATRLKGRQFLIRVNLKDGSSDFVEAESGSNWWYHPKDESVDVAVLSWSTTRIELVDYKCIPETMFLNDEIISQQEIGIGDDVFITGLFAHLSGSKRNLPIVRTGNIAMMPDEKILTKQFGESEAYLIEIRSIGGLSGSPAFVRPSNPNPMIIGQPSVYLLGLTSGHWEIPPERRNEFQTVEDDAIDKVNMGIAVVVPAKKIREVLYHPGLVKERSEQLKDYTTLRSKPA